MDKNQILEQGRRAIVQLRFQDAISISDQILHSDPADVQALYLKAQALSNLEKLPESLALFNRILEIVAPNSDMFWETLVTKGNVLLDMDNVAAADACFDQAIAIAPRVARIWIEKGRVAARRKNFGQSLEYCSRAVSIDPSDPRAWNNKAFALLQLNRVDECIEAAKQAVALKPDYTTAWMWLAQAYERKGDTVRAAECMQKGQGSLQTGMFFETKGHKAVQTQAPPKKRWWPF
jgi:tetratricopeptide (TPR) repeat protein